MSFDPILIAQARREIYAAPYGHKTIKVQQWAQILQVTPQTIYRFVTDPARKRKREGKAIRPELYGWAEIIWRAKNAPPEDAGQLSTIDAIASCLDKKRIPAEASSVNIATFNGIFQKMGWTQKEKRRNRIQAARPNDCHHFDGSSSKFFHIDHKEPGGEYIMRMHRPSGGGYKNKPIPADRMRPYYYALVDDHSGRLAAKVYAAPGENSGDSIHSVSVFWSQMGVPEELSCDQGMLKKAFASRSWVHNFGVQLPPSMPYAKEAHGKIERPWRTIWLKFEMPFYAHVGDWTKFKISLTEFNQQLNNFIAQTYNQLPHRFEKTITKMQAWRRVNLHGGIVTMPDDALRTAGSRIERTVDAFGCIEYKNQILEVMGLHHAKVWVWEGVFGGHIVVQDKATGKKYEVRNFKALDRGEYRAHPATPHEIIMQKEAQPTAVTGKGLYATAKPADEKVISMPIRTKEEREIADPFDIHHYATLADAMKEFNEIVGTFISQDEREGIEAAILENGLSKQFVTDLALEVSGALEVERQRAVG